jgi:multidrug efflux system membrane fusion protein
MIRNKAFWSLLLFITLAMFIYACSPSSKKQSLAVRSIPVEAALAIQKSIPIQMNAMGSVEPFQTISVRSQITAQIRKVLFREG